MDKNELIDFLSEVTEYGVSFAHGNGNEWCKSVLFPAIEKAEDELKEYNELLAECMYLVGDIYDFNDAPLHAIEAYEKAIKFNPYFSDAFREMANMYERLGKYDKALENIKKAIKLDPKDEDAQMDLENIEQSISQNEEPMYVKGDMIWEMNEMLADSKFDEIIEKINDSDGVEELKILARVYGAQKKSSDYLKTWQQIATNEEDYELNYADWFFMPEEVYNSEKIWQLFKTIKDTEDSVFIEHQSLSENYSELLNPQQIRELICDFQIYINTNNTKELQKLKEKYTEWEELFMD
ncbi:MAG: tetratricopeptide repeat protein [Bacteroidales bacterium]|nr:tetratricopeptide repeat protein [Bacteroidales bacterium]